MANKESILITVRDIMFRSGGQGKLFCEAKGMSKGVSCMQIRERRIRAVFQG